MANQSVKIQLRGNCQCCGRQQAVVRGFMSKHGYEVKNHWFQGICSGEKFEPLQKSRVQADQIIASVRRQCVELRALVVELESGKKVPAQARSGKKIEEPGVPRFKWKDEMVPYADAPEWERANALQSAIWNSKQRADSGEQFANDLEKLAGECFGKPLIEVKLDAGPAPIMAGERRQSPGGSVLIASYMHQARVYWKSDKGRPGWTGVQAWRKMPIAEAS